jgi:hypothetical protein
MDSARNVSEPVREQRGWAVAARRAIASLPLWLRVAAAAYTVVALFGLAYVVVSVAWGDLSSSATAAVAGLIAVPLALGLLWPRLTGFAAFGIEVTLAQVTVQPDTELAAAITSRDLGSRDQELVKQMEAITAPEVELLEIDLRDGSYWWSTRLYLLAALAQDLSEVRALIFLADGLDRRFIGIAPPSTVRRALAAQTPELETTYLDVARGAPVEDARLRVSQIVNSWTARSFGPQATVDEGDFATRVSPEALHAAIEAIGRRLNTDSIDWPGYVKPPIVRALIRDFDGEYVALLRAGSFDRVINRRALAAEIAAGTT